MHLSAGDLLRAERNSGSEDGNLIQEYITEGKIVPVEITVNLLDKVNPSSTEIIKINENVSKLRDLFF